MRFLSKRIKEQFRLTNEIFNINVQNLVESLMRENKPRKTSRNFNTKPENNEDSHDHYFFSNHASIKITIYYPNACEIKPDNL